MYGEITRAHCFRVLYHIMRGILCWTSFDSIIRTHRSRWTYKRNDGNYM